MSHFRIHCGLSCVQLKIQAVDSEIFFMPENQLSALSLKYSVIIPKWHLVMHIQKLYMQSQ